MSAVVSSTYRPAHLGMLIEAGDRVQFRGTRTTAFVPYAAWGTVIRNCGFKVLVHFDDGRDFRIFAGELQFAKTGRPPLAPNE
jgi:hypothetical protein